ncbi:hypothetical protein [Streptomyces sp. NPDC005485]|uniref:hypothetical protein n=1 Tax=Streptomyces sp. NPDC005485 TaxID=3155591 RepID=UPI0033AA27B3
MISGEGTEGTGRTEGRNDERNAERNEGRTEGIKGAERAEHMEGTPRGDRPAPMKGRMGQAAQAEDLGGGRTSRTTDTPAREGMDTGRDTGTGTGMGAAARKGSAHDTRLVPHDDTDKLSLRLQHAVGGFVDGPRASIEEADHVLEEAAERLTDAVTQRRRTLRASWQTTGEDSSDTEQLRLALRDYRELTERLLRI